MTVMDEKTKIILAQEAAKTMFTAVVALPADIRLEAAAMFFKAMVIDHIKPQHRLRLFGVVVQGMRKQIKEHLEHQTGAKK